ncbi:hypothetical protein E4U55_005730 [Claviceps digitariae]|nr:hypothetical protein E4U55_005730 [Claviceps digitariae]
MHSQDLPEGAMLNLGAQVKWEPVYKIPSDRVADNHQLIILNTPDKHEHGRPVLQEMQTQPIKAASCRY